MQNAVVQEPDDWRSGGSGPSPLPIVVFGLDSTDYISVAYGDLKEVESSVIVPSPKGVEALLRKVHLSRKIACKVKLPFQSAWAIRDTSKIEICAGIPAIFFLLEAREARSPAYVAYLKKKYPNALICLNLLNPTTWKNTLQWVRAVEGYYDVIVTCSKADADEYGWLYWPDCYSVAEIATPKQMTSDICFVAQDKGRGEMVWQCFEAATALGLTCDFVLIGKSSNGPTSADGFSVLERPMPYREYLKRIIQSKCLLEITEGGSNHCTLRTMEALSYGKILATTNAAVVNEDFYTADQICVLQSVDELETLAEMICSYEGPYPSQAAFFSPRRLIDHLGCIASEMLRR